MFSTSAPGDMRFFICVLSEMGFITSKKKIVLCTNKFLNKTSSPEKRALFGAVKSLSKMVSFSYNYPNNLQFYSLSLDCFILCTFWPSKKRIFGLWKSSNLSVVFLYFKVYHPSDPSSMRSATLPRSDQ